MQMRHTINQRGLNHEITPGITIPIPISRRRRKKLTSINLTRLPIDQHHMFITRQHHKHHQTAHQAPPSLRAKDIREHSASFAEVGPVGGDGGGHGVVAADADAEEDTEAGDPDEGGVRGEVAGWAGDDEDCGEDDEH